MKQRDKSVLFIAEEGPGIARPMVRAKIPARGLKELGWKVKVANVLYEEETHTFNGWVPGEVVPTPTPRFIVAHTFLTPENTKSPDGRDSYQLLVWQSQKDLIESARKHGQKFFFDLDDDIWNIPKWNPAFNSKGGISGHYDTWVDDVNSSNGLIVSTPSIKESAVKSGDITVPIHVVRNCINYQDYNPFHIEHAPLRIGLFSDLEFRKADLEPIISPLYSTLDNKRGIVELWHIGARMEDDKISIRQLLPNFPVDIIERPWVDSEQFERGIALVDVVIIPAIACKFNDGRSNIVGLSCIAGGVPFISSPIAEYRDLSVGYIAYTTKEWESHLQCLVENVAERNLFRKVCCTPDSIIIENATPKVMGYEFERVFEECLT